jgi:hypothetical protein
MRRRRNTPPDADPASAQLTPTRGGDLVGGDQSMRDKVPDPGSYHSSHSGQTDADRGDADDAKVKGRSRR